VANGSLIILQRLRISAVRLARHVHDWHFTSSHNKTIFVDIETAQQGDNNNIVATTTTS